MALDVTKVLAIINGEQPLTNEEKLVLTNKKWVYYKTTLHTKGVCPSFNDPKTGNLIEPPFYNPDSNYKFLFDKFLLSQHPREPDITRNWRYSQYKTYTKDPFAKLTDLIRSAIFQDSQYTLVIENKEDNDYITGNNFFGDTMDMFSFFRDILFPSVINDANGYNVIMPRKSGLNTPNEEAVKPDIYYVSILDVIYDKTESDFIFKSKNDNVEYRYWINITAIYRFIKSDNGKWVLENEDGYFTHSFGYIPAFINGGMWDDDGFFRSYFDKAIAVADDYIGSKSASDLVDKESSYPYIQQLAEECPSCHATGSIQEINENGDPCKVICPSCKGTKIRSFNPGDRYEMSAKDMQETVAVKIISPDININQYHLDKITEIWSSLLQSLDLLHIDQAQSGTAKAIDQDKLNKLCALIRNRIYDVIIYGTIKAIIGYRNIKADNGRLKPKEDGFSISKPADIDIRTTKDLFIDMQDTIKAGVPSYLRIKSIQEYNDKKYGNDKVYLKKTDVISELDITLPYSTEEKQELIDLGGLLKEDIVYSVQLPYLIDKLIKDYKEEAFMSFDIDKIKEITDTYFKPIILKYQKNGEIENTDTRKGDITNSTINK